MFDIIVVGAGPAGATFARLASQKWKVLVIDKKNNNEKCCGGLIAPDAQEMLAVFDIGIPKSIISDPQLLYVRSVDIKTRLERNYQRHYTNVNRKLLDEYMISLLPENVTVRTNCRYLSHQRTGESVSVKLRTKDTIETIKCRLLVGADGAFSRVRRNLYNDFSKRRKYLAIQGEYKRLSNINHYAVFFDREITDFYSWLIPKDESIIIGGAFLEKAKPRLKFEKLITKLRSEYYYFGEKVKISACYIIRPRLQDIKIGEYNIALIGEAAGFISPSSSEGISYAYRSALALTKSLDEMDDVWLRRYRQNTYKLRVNILLKIIKSFFMYNYFLRNIIFKTRIGSLRRV